MRRSAFGSGGLSVHHRLSTNGRRAEAIVAVTGYGQERDHVRSSEAGFDEHLVKPVGLDALRAVLDRSRGAGG